MRLLFLTGSLVHGGAERHAITLMNGLAERGHECHAAYVKNEASQLGRIRLRGNGSIHCLAATRFFDRRALADLVAHLSRIEPSVIIAANAYALMYASLARRLAGSPALVVATFHTTYLLNWKERVKMLIDRFFLRAADCLVFVCAKQQRYWRPRGVFARHNEVIHNGIDPDLFRIERFVDAGREVRRGHGFAESDYVIGISAVLRPEKNHLQLVDALAALRRQGIPGKALLVGDGPMRGAIESHARAAGVMEHIAITGFQEDVRPYIAACDVVVLCSIAVETFSMAALEAMAMSKPVVHSDIGGAAEMITPGQNGFLFPMRDTRSFVHQLGLLANPALARTMGDNARRGVVRFFSERTMLDQYERMLLDLCKRHFGRRTGAVHRARSVDWRTEE